LDDVLVEAATGEKLRPLLGTLPVAQGVGTLEDRYADLPGRAWVRAKTGTLTGTNALAGTVTGDSGRVYTFALLSNDGGDALAVRRALDEFASLLRTA
ncbi:D-alanyl-D-alanine carboxypeptidase, partial [Corynebacterium sp.]|uniref:D-alanyl-D-alanine carboxypeptidase n=1 Tax=Corynebacterium sp. TaxID=1720 RepID=UPI003735C30A